MFFRLVSRINIRVDLYLLQFIGGTDERRWGWEFWGGFRGGRGIGG